MGKIKFVPFIILAILFLMPATTAISADYTIVVAENGNTFVLIALYGSGTLELPLPYDVIEPEIEGALYVQTEVGVELSIGTTEAAEIFYQTFLLTDKEKDKWYFYKSLPELDEINITLSLPENTKIIRTIPNGAILQEEGSKNIYWEFTDFVDSVNVTYDFSDALLTTTQKTTTTTTGVSEEGEKSEDQDPFLYVFFFAIVFTIVFYLVRKKQTKKKPKVPSEEKELSLTGEMSDIISTFTPNEKAIVEVLMKNGGRTMRGDLGRTAEISKSSLAAALYNLEQKKIVEIDKTFTAHEVRLTPWFKSR